MTAAWTRKEGKNAKGGLNEKGRKSYEAANPGSNLKAPVKSGDNPRRASFLARMGNMPGPEPSPAASAPEATPPANPWTANGLKGSLQATFRRR